MLLNKEIGIRCNKYKTPKGNFYEVWNKRDFIVTDKSDIEYFLKKGFVQVGVKETVKKVVKKVVKTKKTTNKVSK